MNEEWRDIPGFEGLYQASNAGRVRSLDRWVEYSATATRSACRRYRKGKDMSLVVSGKNKHYLAVTLSDASQTPRRCLLVHRLVALTFIGPCPEGMEVAHKNGNPRDNKVANLRYASRRENCLDRHEHGRHRFRPDEIPAIRERINNTPRGHRATLAAELGVSIGLIEQIKARKAYRHIA